MRKIYLLLAVACALLASCEMYDDTEIKDAQSSLEERVSELETLKQDLEALKNVVDGLVTVSTCVENETSYTIVLSDGKVITVSKEISGKEEVLSKVEKFGDTLVITLADGVTEYIVPLTDGSEMKFFTVSGAQYFSAGQTKTVQVEMVGIENFTVTEKPDGWKAVLTDGNLKVTAPSDGGEDSGVVKMLGIGKEPVIAQVYVALGSAPCSISIATDMQVTITPVSSCFYGASLQSDFDPKKIAGDLSGVTNPMLSRYPYAMSEVTMPLTDLVDEVMPGETYFVWALPVGGSSLTEADIIYESYSTIYVDYQVSDVTFEDARVAVSLKGTDTYYLVPMADDMTLDNVISDLNGSYAATYDRYLHTSSFRGSISELVDNPLPGQDYELLVLPVKMGVLRKGDAVTFVASLEEYDRGGSASVALEEETKQYKSLSVKVTCEGNPYKVIVSVVEESEYGLKGYSDDTALLDYLSGLQPVIYSGPYTYTASNLSSATDYMVLAAAVDADGKIGAPARLETCTKAVVVGDVTLSVGDFISTQEETLIPLSASGDLVSVRYFLVSDDAGGFQFYSFVDNAPAAVDALVYETIDFVEVPFEQISGGISYTGLQFGVRYLFCAVGFDAQGRITTLAKKDFSPSVGKTISAGDPKWDASCPDVSSRISGNSIFLNVEFPGEVETYSIAWIYSEEYVASWPASARLRADYALSRFSVIEFTENISSYNPGWYVSADKPYILITWKNADGWHEPLVYDSATGQRVN